MMVALILLRLLIAIIMWGSWTCPARNGSVSLGVCKPKVLVQQLQKWVECGTSQHVGSISLKPKHL